MRFNLMKHQHNIDFNDTLCSMILPVLKAIADEKNHHLKNLWLDAGASN
jgi:hypothetical protein